MQLLSQSHLMLLAFLALLFCQAALHKASDLRRFSGYLADYHPRLVTNSFRLAAILLALEASGVAFSVIPATSRYGQSLLALLLAIYTLALVIARRSGKSQIVCGCGETPVRLSSTIILRNLCLLGLAAMMLITPQRSLSMAAFASAVAAGFMLWMVWMLIEQLLHNSDFKQRLTQSTSDQEPL